MNIAIIGTGYVGLVTGTCLADSGNRVTCVDIDAEKIEGLRRGHIPIFEPGLRELVLRNAEAGRLDFTTDLAAAAKNARFIFLAVGTPQDVDGSADLHALMTVIENVAPHLADDAIIVIKSTVPVGTNVKVRARLTELTGRDVSVTNNPEFLKEGAAIGDFVKPDRVVIGVRTAEEEAVLRDLYRPFLRTENPLLAMSPESAELTKYIANAMLATKISFINTMANLTEKMGGDINDVRRGIGHDRRIGFQFLHPGVGYGGSCFPKDVRALRAMFHSVGIAPDLLDAVDAVNEAQKKRLFEMMSAHYGGAEPLQGKTFAVWGLSFKPRTDDIREAPAPTLIDALLAAGARLHVHDPEAQDNVRLAYGERLQYAETPMDALVGADALAINTEWSEFRHPDFAEVRRRLAAPVVFDGRNLYEPQQMRTLGFTYYSIGRPAIV